MTAQTYEIADLNDTYDFQEGDSKNVPNHKLKYIGGGLMIKVFGYMRLIYHFLMSEYTKDILWTGVQVFFALIVLATLSLATIFITVIVNVNEALKTPKSETDIQKETTTENIGDCKELKDPPKKISGILGKGEEN